MRDGSTQQPIACGKARLIAAGEWTSCRLHEVTPEAAVLETDRPLGVGDPVVACIADVGALAGVVSANDGGKISVKFKRVADNRKIEDFAAGYRRPH